MKRNILLILLLGMFLMSFASAEVAVITHQNESSVSYEIDNGLWKWLPDWMGGGTVAVFTKDYSYGSISNSYAGGHGEFFEPGRLVDAIDFYDKLGNNVNSMMKEVVFEYAVEEEVEYVTPVYDIVCEDIVYQNQTTQNVCNSIRVDDNVEIKTEWVWRVYEGEEISGKFMWRLFSVRPVGMDVDWIFTVKGVELLKWDWWDSDWQYKRNVTVLNGSISALYYINSTILNGESFDSIRFADYDTETIELNYSIVERNATHATVRLNNYNYDKAYMYYGNGIASDASDTSAVYYNPIAGYMFDSDANDFTGVYNGTVTGATQSTDAIIGGSYDYDGTEDYIDTNYILPTNNVAISIWVKPDTRSGAPAILGNTQTGAAATDGVQWYWSTTTNVEINRRGVAGANYQLTYPDDNEWHHIVASYTSADGIVVYLDGVYDGNCSTAACKSAFNHGSAFSTGLKIGGFYANGVLNNDFDGRLDELTIYTSSIDATTVSVLYNQTKPYFVLGEQMDQGSSVNLVSPVDEYNSSSNNITFDCGASHTSNISNLSLIIDGAINQTVNGPDTVLNLSSSVVLGDGDHNWTCSATTVSEVTSTATTRNLHIDSTSPVISITSPVSTYGSLYDNQTLDLNWTVSDTNIDSCWYEYDDYLDIEAHPNDQNWHDKNDASHTEFYSSGDGQWVAFKLNYTTTQSDFDLTVLQKTGFGPSATNNTANINSTVCDSYNYQIRLGKTGGIQSDMYDLFCMKDGAWVNLYEDFIADELYEVWINDIYLNDYTNYVNCSLNTTTFQYISGLNNLTFYANDTFGNDASAATTWSPLLIEESQSYNETVISGQSSDFYANVTLVGATDITQAVLHYNGFQETGEIASYGDTRILFITDYIVPIVENSTNISFNWELTLSDSSTINLSQHFQEVLGLSLDNCSTNNFTVLNLSLFDEKTRIPITGDIEAVFQILNTPDYDIVGNITTLLESVSNAQICSSLNLTASGLLYSAEIRYLSDGRVPELYHIQRADIDTFDTALSLFDIVENESTRFKVTYQDDVFDFVEGAILQLQRKYISDDDWEVVEAPLTSNEGVSVVHVDLDSVKYRATIVKNGVILDTFENLVFNCQSELTGECTHTLLGNIDPQNDVPIDAAQDFSYSIDEENGTIQVSYSVPSGSPASINIQVEHNDQFGNTSLCNKTVTSSAGLIECAYTATIGESYLDLKITKDGEPMALQTYVIPEDGDLDFLGNNYMIMVIFLFSLAGMAASSPAWVIINGTLTMVISGAFMLANGLSFVAGLGALLYLIVASVIFIIKISRQSNT